MPRCSHRRPDHRGKSEFRQKAGCPRFNSNQVPLIPPSRGHNYANDLPSASFLVFPSPPPFFFHRPFRCAQKQTVQRSGCSRPALCRTMSNEHLDPIGAPTFFPSNLPFILCPQAICPGPDRVPFPRDFRLEARGGRGAFDLGTWPEPSGQDFY